MEIANKAKKNEKEMETYFQDNGWSTDDFKCSNWTFEEGYNYWYLGSSKNKEGRATNCKGVIIDKYFNVYFTAFNGEGYPTGDYIWIFLDRFEILKIAEQK